VARILHIIPTLDQSGAEKQLTLLACALKQAGHDIHVCCLTHGGPYEAQLKQAHVPVHCIGKRSKLDLPAYFRLKKYIQQLQPDIVHTWLFAANAYGRQAAIACNVPRIFACERCVDPWKSWYHGVIDRHLAKRTEKIVTNSHGVVEFYASRGLPVEKFAVIPNGVEVPHSAQSVINRETFLAAHEIPANARVILAVNRLWPQKRVKDLIWALDLLQCVLDNVYLVILGDGPQRWRLERYSRQVTLDNRVRFLGTQANVADWLQVAACFWLGSEYEGQSNALMEAMSAGVPVVATNIAGNRDLVIPNATGFLVQVGDRAGIAAKTREILENTELAQQLGQAARIRMQETFSIEKMVAGYLELYRI
jgi:glycosyltransferase involved in cell wall biosynthesis